MRLDHEFHTAHDVELFGRAFPHVHEALDSTFPVDSYAHRKNTHYLEWVLRQDWTAEEMRSAIQHIIDDCGYLMVKADWMSPEELVKDGM